MREDSEPFSCTHIPSAHPSSEPPNPPPSSATRIASSPHHQPWTPPSQQLSCSLMRDCHPFARPIPFPQVGASLGTVVCVRAQFCPPGALVSSSMKQDPWPRLTPGQGPYEKPCLRLASVSAASSLPRFPSLFFQSLIPAKGVRREDLGRLCCPCGCCGVGAWPCEDAWAQCPCMSVARVTPALARLGWDSRQTGFGFVKISLVVL